MQTMVLVNSPRAATNEPNFRPAQYTNKSITSTVCELSIDQEFEHIIADTRNTQQTGLIIQYVSDGIDIHTLFSHQIKGGFNFEVQLL
ncbi:hypothetical protein SAMN05216419_10863 [Nitrosomonas cryotolerans]|nr:hypothetical protein SAMN05216419_10863 [Nitrosomonas cryotolerans]